jgi:Xaa-Pro dipeptidase
MHLQIARILREHQLIRCSAEAGVANGISQVFLPHGLGHLIGLQTHDVGGQQMDPSGTQAPPPAEYPALRMTRELSPAMVFTIEPGIYFIPMLLNELRLRSASEDVNWPLLETLIGFGGIRIEDNVVVTEGKPENLTRDAFTRLAGQSA